ncbi:hypothetical protein NITMOv2_0890 [Nitrospira moscoviensis]|uniref:Uncharacterized protein n=1 Tax=Nitrospira moscoviensis TaxID=42253 RepID=A0A0K2G8R1_NITMO|nr:hypothetical protein NITMOv2_0890 [Nitrospira moscoviensis]
MRRRSFVVTRDRPAVPAADYQPERMEAVTDAHRETTACRSAVRRPARHRGLHRLRFCRGFRAA